jgi:DNA-binding transcriptional ArsR family regulator
MTNPATQSRIFKALSVDTRVRMLSLLKKRALCVNAIARTLRITPAAASQHLRILRDVNAVIADKRGYFVHYRANAQTMARWAAQVAELLESVEQKRLQKTRRIDMCNKDGCCQESEKLKGKPNDCAPEQVKECHGDIKNHPCAASQKKK